MKKTILFLVQLPPPVHGASLMNEYLINSKSVNHRYNLLTVDIGTAEANEKIGKFSFKKIATTLAYYLKLLWLLSTKKIAFVYITFSPSGFAFYRDIMYVLLTKLFRKKIVLHMHGKGIGENMNEKYIYKIAAKIGLRNTYIISLSPILANDFPDIPVKRKFIVNNGIPGENNNVVTRSTEPTVRLLYLSNYVKTKGILDLIDAIKTVCIHCTNFQLRLVGKPYDVSIEFLTQYILEKNLENYIEIVGPKYNEEKITELKNADIFIFPTYYKNEAFPLTILEAMQYSLPVISTYEGGIPDIVTDGEDGFLVEQRNIKALSEKIIFLINNPDIRVKIGINAAKKFQEKFTLNNFEANILEAFESIIKD